MSAPEREAAGAGELAAGAVHLLMADDSLACSWGTYVAVCGKLVPAPSLPPWECPEGCECDVYRLYCPDCLREAVRWSVEAGQVDGAPGAVR